MPPRCLCSQVPAGILQSMHRLRPPCGDGMTQAMVWRCQEKGTSAAQSSLSQPDGSLNDPRNYPFVAQRDSLLNLLGPLRRLVAIRACSRFFGCQHHVACTNHINTRLLKTQAHNSQLQRRRRGVQGVSAGSNCTSSHNITNKKRKRKRTIASWLRRQTLHGTRL